MICDVQALGGAMRAILLRILALIFGRLSLANICSNCP